MGNFYVNYTLRGVSQRAVADALAGRACIVTPPQLYTNGELQDEYDSSPGYFDSDAEPSGPAGGDAAKLCAAFGASDPGEVERVLRKSFFDGDGYAFERHNDLVKALAISPFAVGTAYASFDSDELPEGLSLSDIIRTG